MIGFAKNTDILPDDVVFYLVGLRSDLKDPKDNFSAEAEVNICLISDSLLHPYINGMY